MQAADLYQQVGDLFAYCWVFLQSPLFYLGTKPITLWNICLSLMMITIFRDFLDILGIWGYGEDDVSAEYDSRDDD